MKRLILQKPVVARDLDELFDFIAQDKLEPAERFLEVAAESFEFLASMPGAGRRWESKEARLEGIRVYPMPDPYHSYLIFYHAISDGIEVLRVQHGARDLGKTVF